MEFWDTCWKSRGSTHKEMAMHRSADYIRIVLEALVVVAAAAAVVVVVVVAAAVVVVA